MLFYQFYTKKDSLFIVLTVLGIVTNLKYFPSPKYSPSLEDLIKQGKAYLKRSNNIPMAVLGYLTPKEKRAELELAVA